MHNHYSRSEGRGQSQREAIPERFQRIVDGVMDHDRAWFLAHPEHDRFVRDAVPGEFGPTHPGTEWTLVENYGGHLRTRLPVIRIVGSNSEFVTLFDLAGARVRVPFVRLRGDATQEEGKAK